MLKIRLRRMGSTHRPFYRVVVSDSRRVPTAAAIEEVGTYDPRRDPAAIELKRERIEHWVERGARLSPTVKSLYFRDDSPVSPADGPVPPAEPPAPAADGPASP